jgi:hypothetical protein
MYFNFYDSNARCGAFARIGNRPNERYAEMTIAIYQQDGTALFNYKRPEIADNSAFDAGGMRFDVVQPFKHLKVSYDGHAVYLARPHDLEDPRRAFTSNPHQPVALALDWYGLSPMYGGEAPESSEMVFARGHYEQRGAPRARCPWTVSSGASPAWPARSLVGPALVAVAEILPLADRPVRR